MTALPVPGYAAGRLRRHQLRRQRAFQFLKDTHPTQAKFRWEAA